MGRNKRSIQRKYGVGVSVSMKEGNLDERIIVVDGKSKNEHNIHQFL